MGVTFIVTLESNVQRLKMNGRLDEVVVLLGNAAVGVGQVGQRQERRQVRGRRVDAILGNDVTGKRRPSRAVGVARPRVVDDRAHPGEVAAADRFGRHRVCLAHGLLVARALVAAEEEELVALDGAAERAAVLVVAPVALGRARRGEVVLRPQRLVVWNSNAEPRNVLVPLLTCTLIAAPPARPCSASKLLVTTLTVSIDSRAGT